MSASLLVPSASLELADAGQPYDVNVAVTSVDTRNVKFDDQSKPLI